MFHARSKVVKWVMGKLSVHTVMFSVTASSFGVNSLILYMKKNILYIFLKQSEKGQWLLLSGL